MTAALDPRPLFKGDKQAVEQQTGGQPQLHMKQVQPMQQSYLNGDYEVESALPLNSDTGSSRYDADTSRASENRKNDVMNSSAADNTRYSSEYEPQNVMFARRDDRASVATGGGRHLANGLTGVRETSDVDSDFRSMTSSSYLGPEVVEETEVALKEYDYENQQMSLNIEGGATLKGTDNLSKHKFRVITGSRPDSMRDYNTMETPF